MFNKQQLNILPTHCIYVFFVYLIKTAIVSLYWIDLLSALTQTEGAYCAVRTEFLNTVQAMRREEKPTRCHWMVYCTYNVLNMLRALLCPSSGARDYMCIINAYGVRCLGCWLLKVRCRTAGNASGMRDVARLKSSNVLHSGRIAGCPAPDLKQPATKASHTIGGNNTHTGSS